MKRRLLRILLATVVILPLLILTAAYFVLRSETCVKEYILPFVSKQLGLPLSVEGVDIKPLSGLRVAGLRYNCVGTEATCPPNQPLSIRIGSLDVDYDVWALFSKQLLISSLRADDVWVGVANAGSSDSEARRQSAESEAPAPATTPSSDRSSDQGFTYRISNASLVKGTFIFSAAKSAGSYRLEDITLEIPSADSHGDSKLSIKTRASIRSQAASFDSQPISLTAALTQANLFMPSAIGLQLSAGDGALKPLELSGDLVFSKEPYSLTKVAIRSAVIRDTLPKLLAIPVEPLKEFEYSVQGEYTLGTPAAARFDLAVNKSLFIGNGEHDLKGTTIRSNLRVAPDRITISDGNLNIIDAGNTLVSSSLSGDVSYDLYAKPSSITVNASLIDLDRIRSFLGDLNPQPEPAQGTPSPAAPPSSVPSQNPPPSSPPRLPLVTLDVKVDKAIVQKIETSSLTIGITIPTNKTIEKAAVNATFPQGGTLSMNASGVLDSTLSFKASGKEVNMIPFAAAAADAQGQILEGGLKSLDVSISADGKDIRKTLDGHATLAISRMIVPSTLQEQVPFNILFLPLEALIKIFGGAINLMLPASVSSISDSIKQVLDDAGRLGLDESMIDLRFEKGNILFKNVDINTKNLPDFTFKGNVTAEDRLDLTVFIALLKLNLPLPIAGTLNSPLPDIAYVGPELVRGLGLSIGNIAGSAASIFGGGKKDEAPPSATGTAPQNPVKK